MGTVGELRDLISFLDVSGVRPQIGMELPMAEAEAGVRAMLAGQTAGKIVLDR
jgi:NADPH:quinone reductase-like Zn-dependent oxidoreductase